MSSWLTWKMSLVSLSLRNIFLQQNNTYYFSCVCTLILDSCESNFEFPLIWIVLKHFTINKIESHLGIQKSICNIYIQTIFSSEIQLNRKSNIIQGSFRRHQDASKDEFGYNADVIHGHSPMQWNGADISLEGVWEI